MTEQEIEAKSLEERLFELSPLMSAADQMKIVQRDSSREVVVAIPIRSSTKKPSILFKERTHKQITLSGMNMPLKRTNKHFTRQAAEELQVASVTFSAPTVTVASQLRG